MPAAQAGLQEGDRIVSVDGKPIKTWTELTTVIYASADTPITLRVKRQDAETNMRLTPVLKEITDPFGHTKPVGLIGVGPSGAFEPYRVGPAEAVGEAIRQQHEWTVQTFMALGSMITGRMPLRDSVTGPIGLVFLTSEAVQMGISQFLFLVSLLSLSLAIFNLFPIPILDGGHLLFLAMEKLRGRPVSMAIQERSAQVSFVFLVVLILTICVNDVHRFGLVKKLTDLVSP
jgi:regulator of sigma E protease